MVICIHREIGNWITRISELVTESSWVSTCNISHHKIISNKSKIDFALYGLNV